MDVIDKVFELARQGELPEQYYRLMRERFWQAGNFDLANLLANTRDKGLADAFLTAAHIAAQLESQQRLPEAMAAWNQAIQLTSSNAEVFSRRSLLGMRLAWGEPPPPRAPDLSRGSVTYSRLGIYGRFANQIFQYGFLRSYAARHDLEVRTPPWIGRYLFDLDDPLPIGDSLAVGENEYAWQAMLGGTPVAHRSNLDFNSGYFVSDTSCFTPYRALWRKWFTLGGQVMPLVRQSMDALRSLGGPDATLVAIHLRRGDAGYGLHRIAPVEWYLTWLDALWKELEHPMLYVASDDPQMVDTFSRFSPINDAMIAPVPVPGAEYLIDFEVLRHADIVATSRSSFSLLACMLNYNDPVRSFGPDFEAQRLTPFDPWQCHWFREDSSHGEGSARPSLAPVEQWFFDRLLGRQSTVCLAGIRSSGWLEALRHSPVGHRVHILTPEAYALDDFYRAAGITHIHFLDLGAAQDPLSVLEESRPLLRHARIDVVAFNVEQEQFGRLASFLNDASFLLFQWLEQNLAQLTPGDLPAAGGSCLAIHGRLVPFYFNQDKVMIDLPGELAKHGIVPRGVIHIGAHEGEELSNYRTMGAGPILFIEANPEVFERLVARVEGQADVRLIQRAVSDRSGQISLHLMSEDMSGSILPPARHKDYYPSIVEVGTREVAMSTLDELMVEFQLDPGAYNLLSIDIQGAELLALRGALRQLRQIQAINVEVNFDELYAGCAQIDELDVFLEAVGFQRVALTSPWHPTWGDALYVRV